MTIDPATGKAAIEIAKAATPLIAKAFPPLKKLYAVSEAVLRVNYGSYIARSARTYSNICTILDPSVELSLESVYVPLTVQKQNEDLSFEITDFPNSLFRYSRQNLIIDSAGMGKSTLSRYIFLRTPIASKSKLLPIMVELRRMKQEDTLLDFIAREIALFKETNHSKEVLLTLLASEAFLLILDGVDEMHEKTKLCFVEGLREILSQCPKCYLWITSRNDPILTEFPVLSRWRVAPLNREGAYRLINRYERNTDIAKQLIATLKAHATDSIETFLGTPLLVVLLVGSYEHKQYIPVKRSNFYYQVFDALYERHDAIKGGYVRARRTTLGIDQFYSVLRAFCFLLLKEGTVEFDLPVFERKMEEAKTIVAHIPFNCPDLKADLLHSVPMLIEEGGKLRFAHKSMIDFFAAGYVCYDLGPKQPELLSALYKSKQITRFAEMLRFCADLDFSTFRKTILKSLAKEICEYETSSVFSKLNLESEQLQRFHQASFFASFHLAKLEMGEPLQKSKSAARVPTVFHTNRSPTNRLFDSLRVDIFDANRSLLVQFRNAYSFFALLAREQSIGFLTFFESSTELGDKSFSYVIDPLEVDRSKEPHFASVQVDAEVLKMISDHSELELLLSRTSLLANFAQAKDFLDSLEREHESGDKLLDDVIASMTTEASALRQKLARPT